MKVGRLFVAALAAFGLVVPITATQAVATSTPKIDISKQAEGPDSRAVALGASVTFTITVRNPNNTSLTNVKVSDPLVPACARTIGTLAAGGVVSYTCTATNVQTTFTNRACATGKAGLVGVKDCDVSTVKVPGIDIRKQAEGPDNRSVTQGSNVPFTIVVTNTGATTLTSVAVTDAQVPGCARTIGTLAAGGVVTYTCTATNVQTTFTNTACVSGSTGDGTVTDCDPSTVTVLPAAAFILIDEDSIDNGGLPNLFSSTDVNDDFAEIGVRSQLRYFANNVGRTLTLWTGEVGDEGWFAPEFIPSSWVSAGPTGDGLRNYVGNPSQGFPHNVGPGLGGADQTGGNRETRLDKIPTVNPLRATGLRLLVGKTLCGLVYDSDISINYGPLNGNLQGANLGTVAFEVLSVTPLSGQSSGTLPAVTVRIADANQVCERPLSLFTDAPEPLSSSVPYDTGR